MSKVWIILLIVFAIGLCSPFEAYADWDVRSDTWVATDAQGRTLPDYIKCGPPRADRTVGIFYLLWLGIYGGGGPYDISKILAANPTDPQWGPPGTFHHWGEPELGYYRSDDEFVMRKHCRMLVDAGIDVMILDATNGDPYTSHYMKLCQVFQQIRDEGGKTPQICFFLSWDYNNLVQVLYNDLYSKNLYPDLWFRWQGKPLILTKPDGLSSTLQNFFTFRRTWAWSGGVDNWSWMDYYPQTYSYHTQGVPEEISVSIAQQYPPHSGAFSTGLGHGRNWHDGAEPLAAQWDNNGYNFGEQWRRALEVDPPFVFVTEWNEWVAQRLFDAYGNTMFVDQYTQEYSRDIEPMKGGHTDSYYYQLVDNVRRYKGVRAPESPSAAKTIAVDGNFSDWADVAPIFRDYPNDTMQRNTVGWDGLINYVNTTGRNDFIASKVVYDNDYVYFYVETKDSLTPHTDSNWMLLFIDSDCNSSTGWNGYDYLINSPVTDANTTTLKKTTSGWNWATVRSDISYKANGNKMEIKVPRASIGQDNRSDLALDFHWSDNIQKNDDIIEFSVSGDSAPNRRFNYRYSTAPSPISEFKVVSGDKQNTLSWVNPIDSDFVGIKICISTTGYPANPFDGTVLVDKLGTSGSSDSFVHSGLVNGTVYYYSAFAYDGASNFAITAKGVAAPTGPIVLNKSVFDFNSDGWITGTWKSGVYTAGSMLWDGTAGRSGGGMHSYGFGADNQNRSEREGGFIYKGISTASYRNIKLSYDLRVGSLGAAYSGAGNGTATVDHNDIQDQLTVYYSTDYDASKPASAHWTEANAGEGKTWLDRAALLGYQSYGTRTIDFSGVSGITDNPHFALKFRWQFNANVSNGDYGDLDNIVVSGDPLDYGTITNAKNQQDETLMYLGGKLFYLKNSDFGYIEESNRINGIRVEGAISANEGAVVNVTGVMKTTSGGERYIFAWGMQPDGQAFVKPLGANNGSLRNRFLDGLYITAWGMVKPGSITSNSYVISDGSDAGIKVVTQDTPNVSEGQYITVVGAAGLDGGIRVVYKK